MKSRPGFSAIELVTTLTLLALVCAACALVMQSQAGILRHQAEQIAGTETIRTARTVLRGDFGNTGSRDVRSIAADSAALRAFRGWGIVCARSAPRAALRYRGLRMPDDTKDSLLLMDSERVLAFRQSASTSPGCALQPDEQLIVIEPAVTLDDGAVVLFFESGIYHIATDALRYHRPGEARQPLTDQLVDTRQSGFGLDADSSGLTVRLHTRGNVTHALLGEAHIRFGARGP